MATFDSQPPARSAEAEAAKNRGNVHFASGRLMEAAACYAEAIAADPCYAEGMNNLGLVCLEQGDVEAAMAWFEKALALKPGLAQARINLGNALKRIGRLDDAARCFAECAVLAPGLPDARNGQGIVQLAQGRPKEAEAAFRQAIALNPDFVAAHFNLGMALDEQGRFEEAAASFKSVLARVPDHADAHNGLGCVLKEQGRFEEALSSFARALEVAPQHRAAMLNLGNAYRERVDPLKAEACYEKLLALESDNANALSNLGLALQDQGRFADAQAAFLRALAADPSRDATRFYLGLTRLSGGALAEGWTDYEHRFSESCGTRTRAFSPPAWSGQDLAGKSLLIWGEQGIGDEMMFAGQFGEIVARARHCVIECAPKLVPLFARSFPGAHVVPCTDPPHPAARQPFDLQCAAGSLARWLRPTLGSFPQHRGYLVPDPQRVAFWRARLAELGPGPKIGFCWRSSLRTGSRHLHYTSLDQWDPVFALSGVHFINLQYDRCDDELAAARTRFGVPLHAFPQVDLFNDIDEAAALTCALDFVVSAQTSASVIAGALGVPSFVLTYGTPWISLGSGRIPWFPAQRLYPRRWDQPWESILAAISHDLRAEIAPC